MLNPNVRQQAEPDSQLGPDTALSNPSNDVFTTFGHGAGATTDAYSGYGMESYFDQISGYFDTNLVGFDENLTIWHNAFLDEIRSNRATEG